MRILYVILPQNRTIFSYSAGPGRGINLQEIPTRFLHFPILPNYELHPLSTIILFFLIYLLEQL